MAKIKKRRENSRFINGVGLGLRHCHFERFINEKPDIAWLEVHTENFFSLHSPASNYLKKIREDYPLSAHCVGISLGSHELPKKEHLSKIKAFIDYFEPSLVSDHLSWSHTEGQHLPDLMPIPYTDEALNIVVRNIEFTQDYLKRQILIENPSSYLAFKGSYIPEHEFLVEAAKRAGCNLLLDVNNIHVSAHNHGFDAKEYISSIPAEMVKEIHLAGYSVNEIEGKEVLIDTHGAKVFNEVWELFAFVCEKLGSFPTLIEWDTDVPELEVLLDEARQAEEIIAKSASKKKVA